MCVKLDDGVIRDGGDVSVAGVISNLKAESSRWGPWLRLGNVQ